MRRICVLLLALMLSSAMMAKDFVRISYSNRSELEKIFNDPNLTVHYYNNSEVFATATNFDANTMMPENGATDLSRREGSLAANE